MARVALGTAGATGGVDTRRQGNWTWELLGCDCDSAALALSHVTATATVNCAAAAGSDRQRREGHERRSARREELRALHNATATARGLHVIAPLPELSAGETFRLASVNKKAYALQRMEISCECCKASSFYQFIRKFETDPCTPGGPARIVRGFDRAAGGRRKPGQAIATAVSSQLSDTLTRAKRAADVALGTARRRRTAKTAIAPEAREAARVAQQVAFRAKRALSQTPAAQGRGGPGAPPPARRRTAAIPISSTGSSTGASTTSWSTRRRSSTSAPPAKRARTGRSATPAGTSGDGQRCRVRRVA